MRRGVGIVIVALAVLNFVQAASAAPGMLVGARDDGLKWSTAATVGVARDLGLQAMSITVGWTPGQIALAPLDDFLLNQAVVQSSGIRVVVSVFNQGDAPLDELRREEYCTYAGRILTRFPQVNDIVMWNEPNLRFFWRPQFDAAGTSEAPARYQELLARCYDVLHGIRPSVNVVAPATSAWGNDNPNAFSNVSHSPVAFIKAMGAAYRASGRTKPLFDTYGHHPYPGRSNERPWVTHSDEQIVSLGDIERLLGALRDAFGGTAQPTPDSGLPVWYLETGYQTQIDEGKQGLYNGVENWPGSVPDRIPGAPEATPPDDSPAPDQATQLVDSLRMTYCQPAITAVFNFLLRDETDLTGWQSGVLWADGSRKDSYDIFKAVVREVNAGRVECDKLRGAPGLPGAAAVVKPAAAPAAARSLTKLSYRSGKVVPYGFLQPRAQLTLGVTASKNGLAGKQLLFLLGSTGYVGVTDAAGRASVAPMPPPKPGRYRVAVRFSGDTVNLASGLRVGVRVVNSKGRVRSAGAVRVGAGVRATLAAAANGRKTTGTLVLTGRGPARKVRLTALGLRSDKRAAWLNGTDGKKRYIVNVERLAGKPSVRIRIWRDGVLLFKPAVVPAKAFRLTG
jgi:hypothetical protein